MSGGSRSPLLTWLIRAAWIIGLVAFALAVWFAGPLIGFGERRPLDPAWIRLAIIGVVAGSGEPFNPAALIGNSAKLQGLSVGSRDMFEAMGRMIDLKKIFPVVDKVFPFTEAKAAFAAMAAGEHFGKIVLEF